MRPLLIALLIAGCHHEQPAAPQSTAAAPSQRRVLLYRAPMNPAQTSPVPRKDEMGMDYVAVYEDEVTGGGPPGLAPVTIDAERRQLIGLKTAIAERGPLSTTIRTVGRVTFDETRIQYVQTRYEAYVERVYGGFVGKYVRKGEPLLSLYSPDVLATEQEFLLAYRTRQQAGPGGIDLVGAARERLLLWGISPADVDAVAQSGRVRRDFDVYAPISGYIIARKAFPGYKASPAESLFDIADLSRVWVLADVYEYELPRLRVGQSATMTLSYWPGRQWRGRASYIFPSVDPKTRTVRVRLEFENPRDELKTEMFADVILLGPPREVLLVPDSAVVPTGTRAIVFVSLGEGRLLPREVQTGDHADGYYEVRSGLTAGEQVAIDANFLLDSESRLKAVISAMVPAKDGGAP